MNKVFIAIAKSAKACVQQSFAQYTTSQPRLSSLLQLYYTIKDALVIVNAAAALTKTKEFLKTPNVVHHDGPSRQTSDALLKDAEAVSTTRDIKLQRKHFINFQKNIGALSKTVMLSFEQIYEVYCIVKKVFWPSNEQAIKNPCYSMTLLTFGRIKATLQ